jgi:hypothetical protein
MDFDYKKYSLENLEKWMSDALVSSEATPQEIYDVIHKVVEEEYHYHKHQTGRCYDLLALLNGNGKGHLTCDKDDPSEECKNAWTDFWEENYYPEEYKKSKEPTVEDIMPPWGHSDMEALRYTEEELNAMCDSAEKKDKVKKWVLPTEVDGLTGDVIVNLPDDLLESANLKEGDHVEWIDNGEGSYIMKKVTQPLKMEEC